MTELQQRLLEMLKWFHTFCIDNNLRYYALGGTLLGAVRHNGFIPWDDDIDVGMPREDYNKLIELMKKENSRYILEAPLQNKDYVYGFCKIFDTTTTLIENNRYKTRRGIYIDIFPLDGAGDTKEEAVSILHRQSRKRSFIWAQICPINSKRSLFKNLIAACSRLIPPFIYGWRKATKQWIKDCELRAYDENIMVCNMFGNWGEHEISEREWFGVPKLYKFENLAIFGPSDADKYLTAMYGDYLQLPPKEKQISHHDFIFMDLNKSYLTEE